MDISKFEPANNTPLHYFLLFLKSVERQGLSSHTMVTKEDWDNMCGISIQSTLGENASKNNLCFNFYDSGELRTVIHNDEVSDETS